MNIYIHIYYINYEYDHDINESKYVIKNIGYNTSISIENTYTYLVIVIRIDNRNISIFKDITFINFKEVEIYKVVYN